MKRIDVIHHFARDHVASGELSFVYCKSEENASDCLTKALTRPLVEKGLVGLRMIGVLFIECPNSEVARNLQNSCNYHASVIHTLCILHANVVTLTVYSNKFTLVRIDKHLSSLLSPRLPGIPSS
jgi:hypothetical protein